MPDEKMDPMDPRFCKMRGQKDLITMKTGVNKIENQGENWYKLHQKCQMTDFCEKIDQFYHIISGTKCDRDKHILSAKREGQ